MSRTWKNCTGEYNWYDFAYTLRAAAALARDMALSCKQAILDRMLTRGQFVLRHFGWPAVTVGVFTDKLPSPRGLTKSKIDQDLRDGRAIQEALGGGSTVGTASPHGLHPGAGFQRRSILVLNYDPSSVSSLGPGCETAGMS